MLAWGPAFDSRQAIWGRHGALFAVEGRRHRVILWMFVFTVFVFFVWAANAPLEEVTRGTGEVVALRRGQIIQSPEGGIIQSIEVGEGDEVEPGEELVIMDPTQFRAQYEDLEGQTLALRASLSRLRAELRNADHIEFDPDVARQQEIVLIQKHLFEARRRKLAETTAALEQQLVLAKRQLELVKPMVERGAMSAVEGIRQEEKVAELRSRLDEAKNTYYQEVTTEIAKQSSELASLNQQRAQKKAALEHTVLRSPVRGIVKKLNVTTRGGVVQPGETIMEIVPIGDQLLVEAKIKPRDVAFLHTGLPANVKITAYDYAIYGMLSGKLVFISADTIVDETRKDAEPYYRVRVLTDKAALEGPDGPLPIKPGMIAEVDILTGERTVLDYLLKPILRGSEALTER